MVWQSRFLHYNAGAFVSNGETCLVDPGILAEETEALRHDAGAVALVFVVLTHAHWDPFSAPRACRRRRSSRCPVVIVSPGRTGS